MALGAPVLAAALPGSLRRTPSSLRAYEYIGHVVATR